MSRFMRDSLATLLAMGIGVITFAKVMEWDWSIIQNWYEAIAVIGILGAGIVGLTISGFDRETTDEWTMTSVLLVITAAVVAVWGFIIDSMVAFYVLATTLAVYWIVAMFYDWYFSPNHLRKQVLSH